MILPKHRRCLCSRPCARCGFKAALELPESGCSFLPRHAPPSPPPPGGRMQFKRKGRGAPAAADWPQRMDVAARINLYVEFSARPGRPPDSARAPISGAGTRLCRTVGGQRSGPHACTWQPCRGEPSRLFEKLPPCGRSSRALPTSSAGASLGFHGALSG